MFFCFVFFFSLNLTIEMGFAEQKEENRENKVRRKILFEKDKIHGAFKK